MRMFLMAISAAATIGLSACGPGSEPAPEATAVSSPEPAPTAPATAPASMLAPGIPALPEQGASAAAFVPAGWRLEQAVQGDISRDGVPDLAFVLRATDPDKIIRREGFPTDDVNPRILGVALGRADGFQLAAQNHAIFPERDADMLNMDDPFDQGLSMKNGMLTLEFNLFMSMGGGSTGPYQFHFRQQDGAVRLIGYDHTNVERMSGEMTAVSVNFLTGRRTDTSGRIDTDKEETVASRTTVPALPLDQIGDGFAFETERLKPASR
mgnify:CR=1 FL=1